MVNEIVDYLADLKSRKRETSARWYKNNREKVSAAAAEWYRNNRHKVRNRYNASDRRERVLIKKYNVTAEQYEQLLRSQHGVCAICKQTCSTGRLLAIDHDHRCCTGKHTCGKCLRGLLCLNCNQALGKMKDSPALLFAAIDYILKHADK